MKYTTIGEYASSIRCRTLSKNEIRSIILGLENSHEIWEKDRIVRCWIKDLGDTENAERYLTKVENESTTIYDLAVCATLWTECFSNNDRASKCLLKAQKLAVTSSDWLDCYDMWINLCPEAINSAKVCFDMAESLKNRQVGCKKMFRVRR